MKTLKIFTLVVLTLLLNSCVTNKKTNEALFNTAWELEYISGPRIAFEGLYPDNKPTITFDKTTNVVSGSNSCNGYRAEFTLNENTITFGEPGPTTMRYCGQGEEVFLSTIKKIESFKIDSEGKLNLYIKDIPMMRFKKVNLK